ncbi:MAG: tyrosine-type recombinase/integrase [Actinobacteria bacterium]|nr:tyrosine-type recombinase/integrase [Actinomycetota bacterium]
MAGNGSRLHKKNGSAFDPDVASQRFDRMSKDAELPRIRFHDLRHTHATLLLLAGVSPHVVSMRLGHRSVAFTLQQYAHVLPQQQADAVNRLAATVLGEPRES